MFLHTSFSRNKSRLRMIAIHGLEQLNTREARHALWEAGAC